MNIDKASAETADNVVHDGNLPYFGNQFLHAFPFAENLVDIDVIFGLVGDGVVRFIGRLFVGGILGGRAGRVFPGFPLNRLSELRCIPRGTTCSRYC